MRIVVRRSSIIVFAEELPFYILCALNSAPVGSASMNIGINTPLTDDVALEGEKYFIKSTNSKNDTFFVLPRSILPELMRVASDSEIEYSESPVFNPIREITWYSKISEYNEHQQQLFKVASSSVPPYSVTLGNQTGADKYPISLHVAMHYRCPILITVNNKAELEMWYNNHLRELNLNPAEIVTINSITDIRTLHQSKGLFTVYILNTSVISKKTTTQSELNMLWSILGSAGIGLKISIISSSTIPMNVFLVDAYTKIMHTIYIRTGAYMRAEYERIMQYLIPKEGSAGALTAAAEKKNRSIIFSMIDSNPEQSINRKICNMGEVNMTAYADYLSNPDITALYASQIIQIIDKYKSTVVADPKIAVVCPSIEVVSHLTQELHASGTYAHLTTMEEFIADNMNYYNLVINIYPCSYGKTFLDIFNRVYARLSTDSQLVYIVDHKMTSIQNFAKECVTRLQMFPNEFTRILCNNNGVKVAPDVRSSLTYII